MCIRDSHIGPITTSVDLFDFTVSGRGGHGSQPQNTTDPVLAAAQMIVMMQQIVARRVDPMEMAVFSLEMCIRDSIWGVQSFRPSKIYIIRANMTMP